MAAKGKVILLIFLIAGLIAAFWAINTQLNITADSINQEVAANPRQEALVDITQSVPVKGMAISVIGASPVEPVSKPIEIKTNKTVFRTEGSPASSGASRSGAASSSGSGLNSGSGTTSQAGVTINKEPSKEESKGMTSKNIIIF